MRILLFYFAELGHVGGVEMTVVKLAEAFVKRGHLTGILEFSDAWKPHRELESGIPVWGIAAPSEPKWQRPRSWASFTRATLHFAQVVREFGPDVINVHYPLSQALPILGAKLFRHRWRLVVTVHGSEIRVSPSTAPRIGWWQARLLKAADAVTAVSESLLQDTLCKYPDPTGKFQVIPNGVGAEWFGTSPSPAIEEQRYILFVGRLHPVKGPDVLLHAWKQLSPQFPGMQLWLVGDGPEREKLEELAKLLGVSLSTRFLGQKTQRELLTLYRGAEAYVLPSRSEGMPLCLLEAGASRALCIGTRIPGVESIIKEGVTGFLADSESPGSLATAIAGALELRSSENERIRNAMQSLIRRDYSEEKMISGYLQLFESILKK
jgi:glycosyltransferase involved in cell wall biosynthesis